MPCEEDDSELQVALELTTSLTTKLHDLYREKEALLVDIQHYQAALEKCEREAQGAVVSLEASAVVADESPAGAYESDDEDVYQMREQDLVYGDSSTIITQEDKSSDKLFMQILASKVYLYFARRTSRTNNITVSCEEIFENVDVDLRGCSTAPIDLLKKLRCVIWKEDKKSKSILFSRNNEMCNTCCDGTTVFSYCRKHNKKYVYADK